MPARAAALGILLAALTVARAVAFSPALTEEQARHAVASGIAYARAGHGYPMRDYTVWALKDTLSIVPGEGPTDAIVAGTPYERIRYAGYLAGFQGQALSDHDMRRTAARYNDSVTFVVFVHSDDRSERSFLDHFGAAHIVTQNGRSVSAADYDRFGPSLDFYNVVGRGRELRWIGYVGMRFDLRELAHAGVDVSDLRGTLTFRDPRGAAHKYPFDLSHYR